MRNRILGAIGIVWGGAVLANFVMRDESLAGGGKGVGQLTAVVLGAIMIGAGAYYLVLGDGGKRS